MLHPVGQLGQHGIGDVRRRLGDEIDAHALGTDQLDDLLDFGDKGLRGIAEQQMGTTAENIKNSIDAVVTFADAEKVTLPRAIQRLVTHVGLSKFA